MSDTTDRRGLPAAGHRPARHGAEIWVLGTGPGQVAAAEKARHVLDGEERRRAAAYFKAEDRAIYVVAHVGLRLLLGSYLGVRPQDVTLGRAACPLCDGPHGRPEVEADPPLHFSLSHTRDLAVCAFARSPVGVDAEAWTQEAAAELTALLHPEERAAVEKLPEEDRGTAFLRCWVRKEAYLKGTGTGLAVPLDSVHVGFGGSHGDPGLPGGWALAPFAVPSGYEAAVALLAPESAESTGSAGPAGSAESVEPAGAGGVTTVVRPLDLAEAI